MDTIVEVYATKGGEYLGQAWFLGDVTIASVTQHDVEHSEYTALRNSGEVTEMYEFLGTEGSIFYGFEFFVQFPKRVLH